MNVVCPECQKSVNFADVFESAFCWASSSVAFRCPSCQAPAHFTPRGEETEVGFLGSGPPLDAVEGIRYPIHVATYRDGDLLTIQLGALRKTVPSAHSYVAASVARDGL
ncbi:hypothetical protein GCM10027564_32130 [Luteimonas notoginsengisoli]